ncbi:all-trans-8'-apo-beta-carotenal 15,15'-oxygenase [Trinickia symbiotica]|uniref:Carotenoid oxygenase n=1 Tax=Trinickia symbiotica TaxID=863227 RepID=A0A2N7X9A1_9BURK|nr:carotenoid oxygenase family protein [Trinickia symbiotica]PMS38132.1 carotenoid oxygenase [Trinickia symbiotica]PPK47190.1 all-trans-8'-apo-beta-carotenal 15,15'-oxygenase [Trinickia symbiotica]
MLTRREFIRAAAGGVAATALADCGTDMGDASSAPPLPADRKWLTLLAKGMDKEYDHSADVEGRLPVGLTGTLYRNGPGMFARNGFSKRTILDGDGMIRATRFSDGGVRFRNRFVRTTKYVAEESAGEFLYPTWTTPAPGFFSNIPCIPSRSQAGVTPVVKGGVLYAFDEVGGPYPIDPRTLDAGRETNPYEGEAGTGPVNYKAHTKTDAKTGDWVLVGQRGQRKPELHVVVKNSAGHQTRHIAYASPRGRAYFHDFFWADPYAVFHLQPAMLSPLPMLIGTRTFAESLEWRPEEGSMLFVVDTTGARPPLVLDIPASWMWHALNAHVAGNTIVADFVGYDTPDHFLGPDASFRAIMQGREGVAKSPGTLRRMTIDLAARRARVETILAGRYEFPFVPQRRVGQPYRYGYVSSSRVSDQGWFHDGISRIDVTSGKEQAFHFGSGYYVGEPVFAPDPAARGDGEHDTGWLLAEVLEGASGTSFIAVFDANALADGPLAKVRLHHALPFSFHGWWDAAQT